MWYMFRRKIHIVLLNELPLLFQNWPNKLHFPKIVHLEHCLVNTVLVGTKLQYVILWDINIPKRDLSPLSKWLAHELFKKQPEKLWLQKFVQISHCPRKYFASRKAPFGVETQVKSFVAELNIVFIDKSQGVFIHHS